MTTNSIKNAKRGESGLNHASIMIGDVLIAASVGAGLDQKDTLTVYDKSDWQVMAKHDATGETYRLGENGLRFMLKRE